MDSIKTPIEGISVEGLAFHPKVLAELQIELKTQLKALELCPLECLHRLQGRIQEIRFVLELPEKIVARERENARVKAKLAEAKEAE